MRKNRCYLCYGKLKNHVCTECGLDNSKSDQNYHLNRNDSSPGVDYRAIGNEMQNERNSSPNSNVQGRSNTGYQGNVQDSNPKNHAEPTVYKNIGSNRSQTYDTHRTSNNKTVEFKVVAGLVIASILISIGATIFQAVDVDKKSMFTNIFDGVDTEEYPYNPYEYINIDFEEMMGELHEIELTAGDYIVGVDIPEGRYEVSIVEGAGYVEVNNDGIGLYLWYSFAEEENEEYDQIIKAEDVRLFDGTHVTISESVRLLFHTENARTDKMSPRVMEASDRAPVVLSGSSSIEAEYTKYRVPDDISPGFYDLEAIEGGFVNLILVKKAQEENVQEENAQEENVLEENTPEGYEAERRYISMCTTGDLYGCPSYKNFEIQEGDIIEISEGAISFIPAASPE